jgi:hypothetical protein
MCVNTITFTRVPWNFVAFSKQRKPQLSPCATLGDAFTILLLILIDFYLLSLANERSCGFASSKQCSLSSNTALYTVQSLDLSTNTSQRHLETYEGYRVMTIIITIIDIQSYFALFNFWRETVFPATQALASVPCLNILCRSPAEPVKNTQSVPRSKHTVSVIKTSQLMLYREIMAVCSKIHTKHINTLCGQNGEQLNVKLVVHTVTTGL